MVNPIWWKISQNS